MDVTPLGERSSIVRFDALDGITLTGLLSQRSAKSRTCMLFVHGMMGSFTSNVALALVEYASGIDVFSISTRGMGMISGFSKAGRTGRQKRYRIGTCLERFEECVRDIGGAIDAARMMGYRDVVLCGHSTGCQKVAYYQYRMRDRRVKGIILAAPSDDYNMARERLGRRFATAGKACARMMKVGRGDEIMPDESGFSAQRLDSILNLGRIEARMFNYEGQLREFGAIRVPVLAIFGELEDAPKDVGACLEMLGERTASRHFSSAIIEGAGHSFEGTEKELGITASRWAASL